LYEANGRLCVPQLVIACFMRATSASLSSAGTSASHSHSAALDERLNLGTNVLIETGLRLLRQPPSDLGEPFTIRTETWAHLAVSLDVVVGERAVIDVAIGCA
jgi:hypothetical protein